MTLATHFYDWQHNGRPDALPSGCSPNLRALQTELVRRWPFFTDLGCFSARPVRGSTSVPSTHSYGAALDLGYPPSMDPVIRDHVAGFLVAWSAELGVQAIHDYRRRRIWRAGRTMDEADGCTRWWKLQVASSKTGMGMAWANHLHVETTPAMWLEVAEAWERGVT